MEWTRLTERMMEGGTMTVIAPAAEAAAVEVGGGGGGGGGELHDHNDAAIGTIVIVERNDGANGSKKGRQGRFGHRRVVQM